MSSIIIGITNLFNFSGRTNRKDFWIYFIVVCIVLGIISRVTASLFLPSAATTLTDPGAAVSSLYYGHTLIFFLVSLILTAAVICRRIHDIGWSGWLTILAYIIPLLIIVFGVIPGKTK
jgi:uncharacterized membrane protein YhaH (DUF805 family)